MMVDKIHYGGFQPVDRGLCAKALVLRHMKGKGTPVDLVVVC